jgi:uncharacterized protein YqfA (UPF0365 family)
MKQGSVELPCLRKITQVAEGRAAMADYHRSNQAALDQTAKLRAERLARQAMHVEATSKKPKRMAKALRTGNGTRFQGSHFD